MHTFFSRIRQPVKREGAERYLRVTLLSFAAAVLLTRLLLQLTGYPQLGGRSLHIAHVLWGGLLLFVASLLPLIFANRAVYSLSALLSGVGVGLFIDEVGKFITQNNDYFYPPAAPIIYATFLITVLLYLRVSRPPVRSVRAELYRALDGLAELLDHDLDTRERANLQARLQYVVQEARDPAFTRLAQALLDVLSSGTVQLVPDVPDPLERLRERVEAVQARWIARGRLKALLVLGFVFTALPDLLGLFFAGVLILGQHVSPRELGPVLLRTAVEGAAGLLLVIASILLAIGRDRRGIAFGYFSLLFNLTVANLMIFYFDQFRAVLSSLVQFVLFLGALHYRRRFLAPAVRA